MILRTTIVVLLLGVTAKGANLRHNSSNIIYAATRTSDPDKAARERGYRGPEGVEVHASVRAVPLSAWRVRAGHTVCRAGLCETSRICGAQCEPILLRVTTACGISETNRNR